MRRLGLTIVIAITVIMALSTVASAQNGNGNKPTGDPIETGHFEQVFIYDASYDDDTYTGNWLFLENGEFVRGTVNSVEAMDQLTLTYCDYNVQYRGAFGDDGYQDTGWISNTIHCYGYDGDSAYNYLMVHRSDPRFTGDGIPVGWVGWEYHVLTVSGEGNTARLVTSDEALGN